MAIMCFTPISVKNMALKDVLSSSLWTSTHFYMSPAKAHMVEIPNALLNRLTENLCYVA